MKKWNLKSNIDLPNNFFNRIDCFEISRLCIDPEYRKSDLILSLFREIMFTLFSLKESAILTSPPELSKNYERVGYRKLGVEFEIQEIMGEEKIKLSVLHLKLENLFKGEE